MAHPLECCKSLLYLPIVPSSSDTRACNSDWGGVNGVGGAERPPAVRLVHLSDGIGVAVVPASISEECLIARLVYPVGQRWRDGSVVYDFGQGRH